MIISKFQLKPLKIFDDDLDYHIQAEKDIIILMVKKFIIVSMNLMKLIDKDYIRKYSFII